MMLVQEMLSVDCDHSIALSAIRTLSDQMRVLIVSSKIIFWIVRMVNKGMLKMNGLSEYELKKIHYIPAAMKTIR